MKKKVLAFLLASTMVIEPFSVAGAADFSDGTGQDTVQFSDDAEDAPEVETDGVDQFSTDAVGEGEESTETHVQIGDKVWVDFDNDNGIATISGEGSTWDYLMDGTSVPDRNIKNPFVDKNFEKIIIQDGITRIGNYLFFASYNPENNDPWDRRQTGIKEIIFSDTVTEIGDGSFECVKNMSRLELPDSVVKIGNNAFGDINSLETIKLNQGLRKIGHFAFTQSAINTIELPDSVSELGEGVFEWCPNLSQVTGFENISIIPDRLFAYCPLQTYNFQNVTEIGEFAFESSKISELNFSNNLKTIGSQAFLQCDNLIEVVIPDSVVEIENAFRQCDNLKKITLSNNLTEIDSYAFYKCQSLTEITIPKNVERIYDGTFADCSRLKKVTFLGNTECDRGDPFEGCVGLEEIVGYDESYAERYANNKGISFTSLGAKTIQIKIGDTVTANVTGDTVTITGTGETYDDCWWADIKDSNNELDKMSIKRIIVEDGITSLGSELFRNFTNVETIVFPNSLRKIGTLAFYNCRSLENLVIPNGVTNLGNGIFNECDSLKNISFPATLNSIPYLGGIGEDNGLNIENVVINKGIKEIGNNAFANLKNLKNITIPDSVTSIGQYAFENCTSLTNLTLPDSITEIEGCAFSNCTSLDKIILPKNLTSLGDDVFQNCNAEITFHKSLKCIPELGDNAVKKVTIPEGVEIIDDNAFSNSYSLKEIVLPSTITSIGMGAFYGTGLETFTCPPNITRIPGYVFDSTNLSEFLVPDKVTEIDDCAFYNCTNLKKITIPDTVTYIGKDVFKNCRNIEIYGKRDSVAERYAYINGIKFVSGKYKVVFKNNGRTIDTYYIDEGGSVLTPPSLDEKPGYTLSWDADYTNIQEDMVINAVWTKKDNGSGGGTTIIVSPSETTKYTVTFKDRGRIVKTEKVKSGDAAEYPFITRNGYELSWDKDFSKITADVTVNAVWTVIKPDKVTSLTAEVQKNSIDLSWDRSENTDYYLVYRKATTDTEYKQIKKTTKILWTDEDVEPGTEYSYKVVGVASVDGKKYQGADSDIVTAKIGTPQIGDVYSVGNLKYKVTKAKEVNVIGLAKEAVDIKIPSAVSISGKAYKVTSIQDKAFYRNEDIVNVTIGNNVTYVGKYAFYQCPNLETVKFGKRVSTISTCAFTQCPNLENVTLPSSIRKIGAKAFYQCTSIKTLKINGSVLEYIGKKGLAVNKSVTLKLPKKYYSAYQKLIKASSVYAKTKYTKF